MSATMEPATGNAIAVRGRTGECMARLTGLFRRRATWALADQATVSGASFLAVVIIAHGSAPQELGLYGLGFSLIAGLYAIQTALITTPYAMRRHPGAKVSARLAGSAVAMQFALTGAATLVLTLASMAASLTGRGPAGLGPVLMATAVACPALLLREFARRMVYAQLRVDRALAIGIPSTLLHLGLLGAMAWSGTLSAANAMIAMGIGAALGAVIGGAILYRDMARPGRRWRSHMAWSWRFGRWIAAAQAMGAANAHGLLWVVAICLNDEAVGIFTACLWVVMLTNPFVYGLGNLLTPRTAEVLNHDGPPALHRLIVHATVVLAGVTGAFALTLLLAGNHLLAWLYGEAYAGYAHTAGILAVAFAVSAAGMAFNDGLRAMGRSDVELTATTIDTVMTIALGAAAMLLWGLIGLAYANLAGSVAGMAVQLIWYYRLMNRRQTC